MEKIAQTCGGWVHGDGQSRLASVSTDTRSLSPGALFVAIAGEHYDGHDFLPQAIDQGAAAALVSRNGGTALEVPTIHVDDTVRALGALAQARRECFKGPVIAITGSNGKTTTKEMCAEILTAGGLTVHRSPGNLNNHIGLPLSILGLQEESEALVVELGMNQPGEIDTLARIASPDVGAITQIAPAHLGPMGSIEAIAHAKGELFDQLREDGIAVINADDPRVCAQAERFSGRRLSFGFSKEADFFGRIEQAGEQSRFSLRTPEGSCRVTLSAPGPHLVTDALCAAASAWASGALPEDPLAAIRGGLERYEALPGRLRLRVAPDGLKVLDDSYNANPHSVEAALRTLRAVAGDAPAILVLGDMLELGTEGAALHAQVGGVAAELGLDAVIGVGELAAHSVAAAREAGIGQARSCRDGQEVAAWIRGLRAKGATVLVKGSRGTHMETVVAALLQEN